MSKYGIQAATFTGAIHIGRINKAETQFTDKQDATDDTLYAVAEYVRRNFNGGMQMTFHGIADEPDFQLDIKVTPTPADMTPAETQETSE